MVFLSLIFLYLFQCVFIEECNHPQLLHYLPYPVSLSHSGPGHARGSDDNKIDLQVVEGETNDACQGDVNTDSAPKSRICIDEFTAARRIKREDSL